MKPAPSIPRVQALPCGCVGGPGVPGHRCPEAVRLWEACRALGERITTRTPEWRAWVAHFKPRKETP